MDIAKILDFHHMVMLAAGEHDHLDETSCGPLCQHPACWVSNRRKERGAPRRRSLESEESEEESDLPTVKYYNMLDDYGESPKDRYPARFGGRPPQDRSSSMRDMSQPLRSASFGMTTAPFATPVSPDKTSRISQPSMQVVEVQEVFDKDDLNSRWDETFMTRKYLVWVPNPNRQSLKRSKDDTAREEKVRKVTGSEMLLPRDLTETMVPLQIKHEREETILFDEWPVLKKKQTRTKSPIFRHGTYPKTPYNGPKPDIDSEGVRELLSLPRDVLVQVLERTKESDFVSREKIRGIIQEVLDTARDRPSAQTGHDRTLSPSYAGRLQTSDVLLQQKAPLHYNKQRCIRGSHLLEQRPVFQLDDEDKSSSVDTARDVMEASSTQGFPRYKKPLPAISTEDLTALQDTPRSKVQASKERKKIPSISLGLPELPSGLRQTRPFVYNSKHRPDFTLVPVPTPPQSVRSSESLASDHGTTLRVNLPSVSDLCDAEYYAQPGVSRSVEERITAEDGVLHVVSPSLSTKVPKAPAGTPATFHSPTKSLLLREVTAASSLHGGDGLGATPSREISMSPGHKFWVPSATSPGPAASPTDLGLGTIQETAREQLGSNRSSQRTGLNVQFSEPPPQRPTSPLSQAPAEGARAQAGSPEDWPQVTEPTFDTAVGIMGSRSESNFPAEHSALAEHGTSLQRGRSDLGSRGSERSTLARRILDEGAKVESPAPPPPSPEPKEPADKLYPRGSRQESKSRESGAMEPLLEQTESEGSGSPEKKAQGDKPSSHAQSIEPVIQEEVGPSPRPALDPPVPASDQFDPVSKVMVSHVAPRPSASREKLQQTFINVDIPAEDMSSLQAEHGSTPPAFTPSTTASPGKTSPTKFSSPKSSAGPSTPVRKSPSQSPSPKGAEKKGKGKKNVKGRKGSGGKAPTVTDDDRKVDEPK